MFIAEQRLVAAAVASACEATSRSRRRSPRSSPGPTTFCGWRPSRGPASALPVPTGRGDRCRRPVPDGAGGPRHAARGPRLHRAVPSDATSAAALVGPWPTWTALSCGPPAVPTRCSTMPASRSRSAAPRCCAPPARPGHAGRRGVTLHECLAAADQLARRASAPGSSTCTRSAGRHRHADRSRRGHRDGW